MRTLTEKLQGHQIENNPDYQAYKDSRLSVSERISDLLNLMTLEEKIGQMTQLDITVINKTGKQKDVVLDLKKARDTILIHHVGSFLNGEAVETEEWFHYMDQLTRIAVHETRLGIPLIYGIDHMHGASYLKNATIFPHNLNLGATFNPEHAHNSGWVTALEAADLGHHWNFAPVLDLGVNPLWARLYETFGEDPHLASQMGVAYINGLQNNQETAPYKMAATGKHFLGYSDPQSGWDRTPVFLDMQQIHEFHRPSFQKAIDAGLKTMMVNSGELNGIPVHASYEILTTLLRDQMGFEGVIVTDWDDIGKMVNFHYTAKNFKEATYKAISAGIDISMTPLHLEFNTALLELVEEGRISETRIDESVRRILKLKFELGLFENPFPRNDRFNRIGSTENRQKALRAAQDSIVLLKNDKKSLPLSGKKTIGVFGPSANSKRNLAGGWTIAWQGAAEDRYPAGMHTIYSAICEEFPDSEVLMINTDSIQNNPAVKKMDYIIYAAGEEPYAEFVGNITDLRLPKKQIDEIKTLALLKKPIILVLVEGRPRLINEITNLVDAIIFAGLPGFEGAQAIANIISGNVNPSGKMPISYPLSPVHHLNYNHKRSNLYFFNPDVANHIVQNNETSSLFPFGYGLSYTTFNYENLTVSHSKIDENGALTATIAITNTGERDGEETVLWFTSTHFGKITRPIKELKHFEKIYLKAGETRLVSFSITPNLLRYPDHQGRNILEKSTFSVLVGNHKCDFEIIDTIV